VRIGIVITHAAAALPTHSTLHLAEAIVAAGHGLRIFEAADFEIDPRGRVRGRAFVVDGAAEDAPSREALARGLTQRALPRRSVEVDRLDALLLRNNPLDTAVLALAQIVAGRGVRVFNDPAHLLRASSKAWLATLPGVPRPPTLVTGSAAAAEMFASACNHGVVLKPARAGGGRGVSVFPRRGRGHAIEEAFALASQSGDGLVVVQAYVPEADAGEKRLAWLDGELIGAYRRMRADGELRHNLKHGARPEPSPIDAADRAVADALAPHLRDAGTWFAGIDVIGGMCVEVNTLNPGGLHWAGTFSGRPLGPLLVQSLERRFQAPPLRAAGGGR
jgi:glutathione synthase